MLAIDPLKRDSRDLKAIAIVIGAGLLILLCGLWYVQVLSVNRFEAELRKNSFRTVRVPAIRGKILDRNGVSLAENRPVYSVNLYLDELRDLFRKEFKVIKPSGVVLTTAQTKELSELSRYRVASNVVDQVVRALQFTNSNGLDPEKFKKHYEQRLALPLPVIEGLTPRQVALFVERCAAIPAVNLDVQPARSYPLHGAAGHLVGYLRFKDLTDTDDEMRYHYRLPDFEGATGLEAMFDDQMHGRAGARSMLVNNFGYRQNDKEIWPTEPGTNVVLTIDAFLQKESEKALQLKYGAETRGAVVVMDCNNGDILALVSSPSYDPNDFYPRISSEAWQRANDPVLRPLFNRATYGAYPPGSIFKIVTSLAILQSGAAKPNDVITNFGFYVFGKSDSIQDISPRGEYDFERAFKKSSNTYFIHFGLAARIENLLEMGHRFFLGERVGILPSQETSGQFPRYEEIVGHWFPGDTANMCIGQGPIAVTPVQMAVMTSAIANGGKVFWPRLVDRVLPLEVGENVEAQAFPEGRIRGELHIEQRHLATVRAAMRKDVQSDDSDHPTGRLADVPGMFVCGKTGTAEIKKNSAKNDIKHITWFVSFAPYEQPRYAVVVMIENVASGGSDCAPVAGQIYRAIQKRERLGQQVKPALAAKK